MVGCLKAFCGGMPSLYQPNEFYGIKKNVKRYNRDRKKIKKAVLDEMKFYINFRCFEP